MRLATLSSLLLVLGLALPACGGESVEDRARTLKSQRQQPAVPATDPNSTSQSAPLMAPAPMAPAPLMAPTAPPPASASSSAAPAPPPPPG